MSSLLRVGTRHGFDTLEVDSPANRNAMSVELLQALHEEVRRSGAGTGRGLLVHHTGPAFCSGVDLKERKALGPADASHSMLLAELLRELWHYPKPVVASVDGAVRGGGLGVLACADVVLATPRSTFAYSESRVGVAPALVMAVTLPLASTRTLMPRLLDGAVFDAATAHGLGLVGRIIDGDEAVDDVLIELRQGAPDAQAAIKRLAREWSEVDMDGLIEEMTALSADLFAAPEAAEGVAAFTSKRSPSWAVTS
jgi:enoyl-CoA hydratase/carnithine racemase